MATLVYLMNVSLDGFVETPDHRVDWAADDPELFGWFTGQLRVASALLYGRRLYETMAPFWPLAASDPTAAPALRAYGEAWTAVPKVVFSSTLTGVAHNSRLVAGDPVDELGRLGAEFDGELHVGGPTLASTFVRRDLVDVYRLIVHPVALGAGTPFWPPLERPLQLRRTEIRQFPSGATLLEYVRP